MKRANIRWFLSSYFLYECGRAMYFVFISWFLYQWTQDAIYTGFLVSFGFLPGLFTNLVFGVLVDRTNRKRLALIAGFSSTITLILLLCFFLGDWIQAWIIIGSHMLLQTAGSLFRPSLQALVAEVFESEDLPRIFSWSGSATITGSLCGAAAGGVLAGFLPAAASIGIVILIYALASLTVMPLSYKSILHHPHQPSTSFFKEMKEGFIYLHHHQMLYGLFLMLMLGQLTFHTTLGFLSVYTSAHLQQNSVVYGLLDSTFSIGGVLAGLLGTWWWAKCRNYVAVWSLSLTGGGLITVGLSQNLWSSLLGFLFIGIGTSFVRALLQSIQQMGTDPHFHGRMSSFRMLCNQTSIVLTGPFFGFIAASGGPANVFLLLTVPVCIGVIRAVFQSKNPSFAAITKRSTA
ncbi:MFS transporter [Halobacillus litoralis]|uniref:MFS transporter n=1 Tax=Halobacillus litoralis TaxID=45668 RepID=UPI001CFD78E8|nr:MFS transporter [Halobacillus litoralis]